MKIGIIVGSHRQDSQSAKIAGFLSELLKAKGADTWTLDIGKTPLPLWDEAVFSKSGKWDVLNELSAKLHASDAFVLVTPEWHGMVPSGMKNFMLLWASGGELAHKPALLCAVSVSGGGTNPIAEMRMSGYKNNRVCYLPEHLIVRNCAKVMNPDEADNDSELHTLIADRADYCAAQLIAYAEAFVGIRASGTTSLDHYKNGM